MTSRRHSEKIWILRFNSQNVPRCRTSNFKYQGFPTPIKSNLSNLLFKTGGSEPVYQYTQNGAGWTREFSFVMVNLEVALVVVSNAVFVIFKSTICYTEYADRPWQYKTT